VFLREMLFRLFVGDITRDAGKAHYLAGFPVDLGAGARQPQVENVGTDVHQPLCNSLFQTRAAVPRLEMFPEGPTDAPGDVFVEFDAQFAGMP
jgi:hypothetical protein